MSNKPSREATVVLDVARAKQLSELELMLAAMLHRGALLRAEEVSVFARVTMVQGSPNRMDEGICYFQEQVVPTVAAMEGFQGAYLLINRESGKTVRITFWETVETEQDSAVVVPQIRREGAEVLRDWRDPLPKQPVVEVYEVAVKVRGEH